jgi:hypothetical protein
MAIPSAWCEVSVEANGLANNIAHTHVSMYTSKQRLAKGRLAIAPLSYSRRASMFWTPSPWRRCGQWQTKALEAGIYRLQ